MQSYNSKCKQGNQKFYNLIILYSKNKLFL